MEPQKVSFFGSIRGRLILANLSLVLVLLAISVVSSSQLAGLAKTIGVVADSADLLLRLGHVADERESVTGAFKTGYSDGDDSGARAKLDALLADFSEHLDKAQSLAGGSDEAKLIAAGREQFKKVETGLKNWSTLDEDGRVEFSAESEDLLTDAMTSVSKAKLLASKNMEMRLTSVKAELRRPVVLLWAATAVGCVLALLVSMFTNRRVAQPIANLMKGVEELGAGKLQQIEVTSNDELGRLEASFNSMASSITEKTRSLELVLDNVGDALFTVDRSSKLTGRPSRRALEWFGSPSEGETLMSYLVKNDEKLSFSLENGFEQLIDGFLPFDIAADQLPKEIERDDRVYALAVRPVEVNGVLERVLVVVTDVTEQRELAEKEKRSRDRYSLASLGMRDPDAYQDFVRDTTSRLERAFRNEQVLLELHTIKGNSGVVGCDAFAEVVHEAETALAENHPLEMVLDRVQSEWLSLQTESEKALGRTANEVIVVRRDQYDRLLRIVADPSRSKDAHELLESWSMHQVGSSLARLATTAERYATRAGKKVEVRHEGDHIAVRRGQLDELWACLSHLVKNAVAHGIESEEERVSSGKSAVASIVVSAKVEQGALEVQVKDDGKGIDWKRLAQKSGMKEDPGIDLFLAGVSTANEVSELAGRGVGVAAVVEVAKSLGGTVEVESEQNRGSTFKIKVPVEEKATYAQKPSLVPGAIRKTGNTG